MRNEKKQFVVDLEVGKPVNSIFAVSRKMVKKKKNGDDFCLITLQDKGGHIQGVIWTEVFSRMPEFEEGDFISVKGNVSQYRDSKQLTVEYLEKIADESAIEYSDFIRTTGKDIASMFSEIESIIDSVKNRHLRQLLEVFFKERKFARDFCTATAAVQYHHAYRGGLLEHTLSVCRVCDMVAGVYENTNRDLLIAGALLHDIGKIKEYEVGVIIKVTDQGKLLGHISMGYSWVLEKIGEIKGFPDDLRERVLHIIISHHGYKEFGSPKRPKIMEAFIVHHVDYMDAEVAAYNLLLEEGNDDSDWSQFVKGFERSVLLRRLDNADYSPQENSKAKGKGTGQEGLF
ncbi:MAG: 3'-5' exoribonuclease YhaM family protein [Actinomycetota bacterium]